MSMECTWHSLNAHLAMNCYFKSICTETSNRNLWMYWREITTNLASHSLNSMNRLFLIFLLTHWRYYATFNLVIKVQIWALKLDFELIQTKLLNANWNEGYDNLQFTILHACVNRFTTSKKFMARLSKQDLAWSADTFLNVQTKLRSFSIFIWFLYVNVSLLVVRTF